MSIKIVTVLGTLRPGNFTAQALSVVESELSKNDKVEVERVDPAELSLPFPGQKGGEETAKTLQSLFGKADGIIFATPEYHGSFSAVTKAILENSGFPSAISAKPIALLGVAAGVLGAIKSLEHLRSVTSHMGGLILPGTVSVAGVNKVFDAEGACIDPGTEKRLRGLGSGLLDYIHHNLCSRHCLEEFARNS